jgi:hypothetical protein
MTFEEELLKALSLLATCNHTLIMSDMDIFLSTYFSSADRYENSPKDEYNLLAQLNRVYEIRAAIEKIQKSLTSEHEEQNHFLVSSGAYRTVYCAIQARNNSVPELEEIADKADLLSDSDQSAKESLLGAYRSCRESYIVVGEMVKIYNLHNPSNKLPKVRVPDKLE